MAKLGAPTPRNALNLVSSRQTMQASYLPKSHLTCGWNKGEEQFPEEGNEVHDVVPTRGQLLFIIASSVVSYKKRKLGNQKS